MLRQLDLERIHRFAKEGVIPRGNNVPANLGFHHQGIDR